MIVEDFHLETVAFYVLIFAAFIQFVGKVCFAICCFPRLLTFLALLVYSDIPWAIEALTSKPFSLNLFLCWFHIGVIFFWSSEWISLLHPFHRYLPVSEFETWLLPLHLISRWSSAFWPYTWSPQARCRLTGFFLQTSYHHTPKWIPCWVCLFSFTSNRRLIWTQKSVFGI